MELHVSKVYLDHKFLSILIAFFLHLCVYKRYGLAELRQYSDEDCMRCGVFMYSHQPYLKHIYIP